MVDIECDGAVVIVAVLADEDDVGCSADSCSGDDVGGACSVYFSDGHLYDFSVLG